MTDLNQQQLEAEEYYKKQIKNNRIDELIKTKTCLNNIFGKENNQIELKVSTTNYDREMFTGYSSYLNFLEKKKSCTNYEIMIYFPKIEIKNYRKKSHIILDLYVKFSLGYNLTLSSGLQGIRTTFTEEEVKYSYSHSHLPGTCFSDFSRFCLGIGPIAQIQNVLYNGYSDIDMEIYLLSINQYVRYESIEGTPYRQFEGIGINKVENIYIPPHVVRGLFKIIKPFIKENYKYLTISIDSLKVNITSSDEFEKKLINFLDRRIEYPIIEDAVTLDYLRSSYKVIKLSNGEYGLYKKASFTDTAPEGFIEFKKNKRNYKIILNEQEENSENYYPHPSITKSICRTFGEIITKNIIKQQRAKRADKARNKSKITESNFLVVS